MMTNDTVEAKIVSTLTEIWNEALDSELLIAGDIVVAATPAVVSYYLKGR